MTALQLNHVQSYLGVWVQNTHPCWGGEQVMDGWMNKILFVMILFPLSSSEAVVQDDFFFFLVLTPLAEKQISTLGTSVLE